MIRTIKERCSQDHECAAKNLCPEQAIVQVEYEAPNVIPEKCDPKCNLCVENCPNHVFLKE
jgi:Na+-translocating ferredoxin:NAD+ oxidoreductase RNF subunit RnfB